MVFVSVACIGLDLTRAVGIEDWFDRDLLSSLTILLREIRQVGHLLGVNLGVVGPTTWTARIEMRAGD